MTASPSPSPLHPRSRPHLGYRLLLRPHSRFVRVRTRTLAALIPIPIFVHSVLKALVETLRPLLWSAASVEPALYIVLRVLRGCYTPPQPFWTAADRHAADARDLTGGVATSGARFVPVASAQGVHLRRYGTVMYPGLSAANYMMRLSHLHAILFPGWAGLASTVGRLAHELCEGKTVGLLRLVGCGALSELPASAALIDVLAEIIVCFASHAVQWTVERVIMPFLKFRRRSDASAAYALAAMRALALMLDPVSDFTSSDQRMQRDVPALLAPAIDGLINAADSQCGIQQLGIRYYPLPVDHFDGSTPDTFAQQQAVFGIDFGPHPLGQTEPSTACQTHSRRTLEEHVATEKQWQRESLIRLIASRGNSRMRADGANVQIWLSCG